MKLVITGGAGFLGYHLCNILSDKYDEIFVLDISSIDLTEYPSNIKYFKADIRNLNQLNDIFKKVDFIIHAAAALPLWNKKDIFDVNVNGTANVFEAAKNNGIKRIVYISSTAVYGIPQRHPVYEDDPVIGVGPYGESKIEAEKICRRYREEGMCISVIRPKTFIGVGRLGVFYILYDWVGSGKKIPIIGNGKNRFQLLEVNDLVDAIYLLLSIDSPEKINCVFNIGAEEFNTVLEDVGALCDFAATGAKILPISAKIAKPILALFEKLNLSPLYKWVYATADKDSYVSIQKIKEILGWSPKYSNAQALINSYKWYLEHKDDISEVGITHRVAWKQGILALAKWFL